MAELPAPTARDLRIMFSLLYNKQLFDGISKSQCDSGHHEWVNVNICKDQVCVVYHVPRYNCAYCKIERYDVCKHEWKYTGDSKTCRVCNKYEPAPVCEHDFEAVGGFNVCKKCKLQTMRLRGDGFYATPIDAGQFGNVTSPAVSTLGLFAFGNAALDNEKPRPICPELSHEWIRSVFGGYYCSRCNSTK